MLLDALHRSKSIATIKEYLQIELQMDDIVDDGF